MESRASATRSDAGTPPLRIRWTLVWLAWLGVAFVFIAQNAVAALAAGRPIDPQWVIYHELIYWGLWAALTPLVLSWARRHPLVPATRGAWLAHGGLALIVAPAQTFLTYTLHLLFRLVLGLTPIAAAGEWLLARRAAFYVISLTNLWKYAIVVGVYVAFDYYHRFRAQERVGHELMLRTTDLEKRLAETRLEALRMQLHPHFLFNTLNSISVLNTEDPERANHMLLRLSELLRTVLETETAEISLGRELDLLEQYLAIQRIRYEERLSVSFDVDPAARRAAVPSFLLQPLVENAIRHGVERSPGRSRVHIGAERADGRVRITIENDLAATDGAASRGNGSGIGLANTRERLLRAYGTDHTFEVLADDGRFAIRIDIPCPRDTAE